MRRLLNIFIPHSENVSTIPYQEPLRDRSYAPIGASGPTITRPALRQAETHSSFVFSSIPLPSDRFLVHYHGFY